MHAKRTLLTLALALALLSGGLPGAQASLLEDAVDAAGGGGELTAHKDLYHQDAEGTVSFENLEQRVLDNATTVKMLDETIASIDATDFDKMYDDLRDGLNKISDFQYLLIKTGQKESYTYQKLADQYASMEQTFDDLKEGKLQTDAEAAKRQLQDAKYQTVMGAETLYIAILEMQNTRQGLQRQLDALDRSPDAPAGQGRPHSAAKRPCHPGDEPGQLHPPAGGDAGSSPDRHTDLRRCAQGIQGPGGRDVPGRGPCRRQGKELHPLRRQA